MGFPYPYPLGLPKGSVRATITLVLSVNLIYLTYLSSTIASKVATMAVVALSFYFGGRMHGAIIPHDVDKSQRAWGLPAGSIRSILILLFGGSAFYFYFVRNYLPNYLLEIIYLILGYLVGTIFNKLFLQVSPKRDKKSFIVDNLKAIGTLGVTGVTVFYTIFDPTFVYMQTLIFTTSILLGFYFGSREKHKTQND